MTAAEIYTARVDAVRAQRACLHEAEHVHCTRD
jgi:hypothetical protein